MAKKKLSVLISLSYMTSHKTETITIIKGSLCILAMADHDIAIDTMKLDDSQVTPFKDQFKKAKRRHVVTIFGLGSGDTRETVGKIMQTNFFSRREMQLKSHNNVTQDSHSVFFLYFVIFLTVACWCCVLCWCLLMKFFKEKLIYC